MKVQMLPGWQCETCGVPIETLEAQRLGEPGAEVIAGPCGHHQPAILAGFGA